MAPSILHKLYRRCTSRTRNMNLYSSCPQTSGHLACSCHLGQEIARILSLSVEPVVDDDERLESFRIPEGQVQLQILLRPLGTTGHASPWDHILLWTHHGYCTCNHPPPALALNLIPSQPPSPTLNKVLQCALRH